VAAVALLLVTLACTAERGDLPQASSPPSPTDVRRSPTNVSETPRRTSEWLRAACRLPAEQVLRISRGHYPKRSPDLILVPESPNYSGSFTVTSHAGPAPYLQQVPLVFHGPGQIAGAGPISVAREVTVADVAPTLAELLGTSWPKRRAGEVLDEVLSQSRDARDLRLIVVVVWDGGGWNVLKQWPHAWPTLRRVMQDGTSIKGATVGSSPSVTPAVHATIGTGSFPARHGIVDIPLRHRGRMIGSFRARSPRHLEATTLADIYDQATRNRALIGMYAEHSWHLGMLGHGAFLRRGDKDLAVLVRSDGRLRTNYRFYRLPRYIERIEAPRRSLRAVDAIDGEINSKWRGHPLTTDPQDLRATPVSIPLQTKVIKTLLEKEGFGRDRIPDLFFTNYKQIDIIGHAWNMVNPEVRDALRYSDEALADIIRFLNREIGRGAWALVLTADHGQQPAPRTVGAWPYSVKDLATDAAAAVGVPADELVREERPTGLWLDKRVLALSKATVGDVADFILARTAKDDPVSEAPDLPQGYESTLNEKIFAAAFPSKRLKRVARCTGAQ
jgi:hypothetical protein